MCVSHELLRRALRSVRYVLVPSDLDVILAISDRKWYVV
jgi:hypothetical protein